jgi:HEPN domain-containing protein
MRSREEVIRDFVQQWLQKADEDLAAAQILVRRRLRDYFTAAFHCQQATEKYLKAYLVRHQVEFRKTHDLGQLLNLVGRADPALAQELAASEWLTPYGVEFRYPGDYLTVDRKTARDAVAEAQRVRLVILTRLEVYLTGKA